MDLRQFIITSPAGLVLSVPTWTGGSPVYAIIGAVVTLLPCLLPYVFRLLPYGLVIFMHLRGKSVTVEDHGVKIVVDDGEPHPNTSSLPSPDRARLLRDPTEARST